MCCASAGNTDASAISIALRTSSAAIASGSTGVAGALGSDAEAPSGVGGAADSGSGPPAGSVGGAGAAGTLAAAEAEETAAVTCETAGWAAAAVPGATASASARADCISPVTSPATSPRPSGSAARASPGLASAPQTIAARTQPRANGLFNANLD